MATLPNEIAHFSFYCLFFNFNYFYFLPSMNNINYNDFFLRKKKKFSLNIEFSIFDIVKI